MADEPEDNADWSLATWDGATRETLRRWAELPLERIIAALEEMQELNEALRSSETSAAEPQSMTNIQESCSDYEHGTGNHSMPDKSK